MCLIRRLGLRGWPRSRGLNRSSRWHNLTCRDGVPSELPVVLGRGPDILAIDVVAQEQHQLTIENVLHQELNDRRPGPGPDSSAYNAAASHARYPLGNWQLFTADKVWVKP